MNLKKSFILVAFMAAMLMVVGFQSSPDHKVLFEKAKFTMETKGDLRGAIELFNEIIEKYPDEREYAAKSQLHIGLCYEKLGLKEAQKAYQQVIDNYPEQAEAVKVAKEKLSVLLRAQTVVEKGDKEFRMRQVWSGPGPEVDVQGSASPDGRYLSYVDWDTGDLAIREIATGKKRRLTNKGSWFESPEQAFSSKWSPDGKKVAYAWLNKHGFFDLCIIGLDGSEPRVLYRHEEAGYIGPDDWAPDAKNVLATLSREDGSRHIVLISVADGSVRFLKKCDKRYPGGGLFSPDGCYIVYDLPPQEDAPERDIFLLSTDGSHEIPLVEHPANDFVLGWAPDGRNILFASDRTGTWDAWVIQVADGKPHGDPELIKKDIGQMQPMGFTRKGSFYYGLRTGMKDVYIATLDLEKGKLLTPPTKATQRFVGSNSWPDWSPDGRYLAYISQRGRSQELGSKILCIRSLETGEEREISLNMLHSIRETRWSPNGRSVLVNAKAMKGRRQGFYRIDVQTGDVTPLVQVNRPQEYVQHASWFPDGKAILYRYSHITKKLSRILLRDLESGQDKELFRAVAPYRVQHLGLALSPDGQKLAFIIRDGVTKSLILKLMPVAGGEPHELFRVQEPEWIYVHFWTLDGRQVLFSRIKDFIKMEQELWRIPAEGGEPQKLGLAMDRLGDLRVHPDGRLIAFTAGKASAEIWVMENFLPEEKPQKKSPSRQ